jgi:hypothetical protein
MKEPLRRTRLQHFSDEPTLVTWNSRWWRTFVNHLSDQDIGILIHRMRSVIDLCHREQEKRDNK